PAGRLNPICVSDDRSVRSMSVPSGDETKQPSIALRPPDEATVEGIIEDIEDLEQARSEPENQDVRVPLWKRLGPGLITGIADDDPSGIGTYSVAGSQFGLGLL